MRLNLLTAFLSFFLFACGTPTQRTEIASANTSKTVASVTPEVRSDIPSKNELDQKLSALTDIEIQTQGTRADGIMNCVYSTANNGNVFAEIAVISDRGKVVGIYIEYNSLERKVALMRTGKGIEVITNKGNEVVTDPRVAVLMSKAEEVFYKTQKDNVPENDWRDLYYKYTFDFPKNWYTSTDDLEGQQSG